MTVQEMMMELGLKARGAARGLARLDTVAKNRALESMAEGLEAGRKVIQEENAKDVKAAEAAGGYRRIYRKTGPVGQGHR